MCCAGVYACVCVEVCVCVFMCGVSCVKIVCESRVVSLIAHVSLSHPTAFGWRPQSIYFTMYSRLCSVRHDDVDDDGVRSVNALARELGICCPHHGSAASHSSAGMRFPRMLRTMSGMCTGHDAHMFRTPNAVGDAKTGEGGDSNAHRCTRANDGWLRDVL